MPSVIYRTTGTIFSRLLVCRGQGSNSKWYSFHEYANETIAISFNKHNEKCLNSSLVLITCFYNNIWHILDGSKHPSFRMVMSGVGRMASGVKRLLKFTFWLSCAHFFTLQWIASIFAMHVYLIEPHILNGHVSRSSYLSLKVRVQIFRRLQRFTFW